MRTSPFALRIHLPEGIDLALTLAGPISRALAFFIDIGAVTAIASVCQKFASLAQFISRDVGAAFLILMYFVCWTFYDMLCEYYWRGQTLGKWLLGLRVMDSAALELRFHQVAIRNLLRSLDLLPVLGLVGATSILLTDKLQRLGDLAASTVVVRTASFAIPNPDIYSRGRYNSLLQHPLLCARLRQKVPQPVAVLASDALTRRDSLEDTARVRLFDEFARYLQSLLPMPEEMAEHLTSEQLVRNVVEVLYAKVQGSTKALTH